MAIVLILKNSQQTISASLKNQKVTIGRSRKADVTLDDKQLSGIHCEICLEDKNLIFYDLGSTNGTFLNGQKKSSGKLIIGDVLKIGKTLLKISKEDLTKDEKKQFSPEHLTETKSNSTASKPQQNDNSLSLKIEVPDEDTVTNSQVKRDKERFETKTEIELGTSKQNKGIPKPNEKNLANKLEKEGYKATGSTQFITLDKTKKKTKAAKELDFSQKKKKKAPKKKNLFSKILSPFAEKDSDDD